MTAADSQPATTVAWWRRLGPWLGIGASPVGLMVGGGVAEGNERWYLVGAVVAGTAALVALAVAQGALGTRRRSRFPGIARDTLGVDGSRFVASPVVAAMMLGWFAFNTGIAGAGLGKLVGIPRQAGVAIFAAVMLGVAWRGLNTLSLAALVAGCATILLAADGLRRALAGHEAPLLGDGRPVGNLGFLAAVTVMVGYGAAFALRTPDFTHDLRRGRDVAWCGIIGLALPLVAFALAGGVLTLATGTWNLVEVLERIGSPSVAYAFVVLGFTDSVLTNLHSGAIALEDLAGVDSHHRALVAVAVAGTALATLDVARWMVPYLTIMAVAAPCLIGVMWHYELRRRRVAVARVRWGAVCAWVVGGATGAALAVMDNPLALPVAMVLALMTAVVAHLVLK